MSYRNFEAIPSQIILKQKQAVRIKQNQLTQKFKWLSKYLAPQNEDNFDDHNIIAKSAKFHQKTLSRKSKNRFNTQIQGLLLKIDEQPTRLNQLKQSCTQSLKQSSKRPLMSDKKTKKGSLIIQPIKIDKLRGKSFLLHNFNSTSNGKFHNRRQKVKTVMNEGKIKANTKKRKAVVQQRFLLSPWGFEQQQDKENVDFNDQIAFS